MNDPGPQKNILFRNVNGDIIWWTIESPQGTVLWKNNWWDVASLRIPEIRRIVDMEITEACDGYEIPLDSVTPLLELGTERLVGYDQY